MSVLEKLTEGIVNRSLQRDGSALLSKWERTGLLEGLGNEQSKNGMARLLENQAAQLLREASSMAGGDVEGFASVAFPIVRRVFGGLIANDLVSVQPMSLPSGLIFFMDFQHTDARLAYTAADSIYGGGVVGRQITGGVDLGGTDVANAESSFYALNQGYTSPVTGAMGQGGAGIGGSSAGSRQLTVLVRGSGTLGSSSSDDIGVAFTPASDTNICDTQDELDKLCRFDPDLSGTSVVIASVSSSCFTQLGKPNEANLMSISLGTNSVSGTLVRRLTAYEDAKTGDDSANENILLVFATTGSDGTNHTRIAALSQSLGTLTGIPMTQQFAYAANDKFNANSDEALGAVVGAAEWLLESDATTVSGNFSDTLGDIPEIDIKVDSIAVTAVTKKLKAKWTPELGQDLNAYHNLDAEVELTSVLSEQIALEIDREILNDLIRGATGGTLYWSRRPGAFINRESGAAEDGGTAPPDFTGNVSEWYETLVETINDVSARIHRKTLRGGANFVVVSPEVANILEFTSGFRANVVHDGDKGSVGAVKAGNLSKKWDVYVDPYFPRNLVLVGRNGGSFLETGYVYAPYVPLQVTPTIFGTEDFVPRKGVMTRYAKKMVRPDMYGLVVVKNLLG